MVLLLDVLDVVVDVMIACLVVLLDVDDPIEYSVFNRVAIVFVPSRGATGGDC